MKKPADKNISEQARGHIVDPKNIGRMNDPDGAAFVKGQCGDTMEMYLVIEKEVIKDVLFTTDGCGITTACGSVVTELVKGKKIKEALRISPASVIDILGDYLGADPHCAILAVTTFHKALADYLLKN
jgi:nitrogen fixation NifU-like protein